MGYWTLLSKHSGGWEKIKKFGGDTLWYRPLCIVKADNERDARRVAVVREIVEYASNYFNPGIPGLSSDHTEECTVVSQLGPVDAADWWWDNKVSDHEVLCPVPADEIGLTDDKGRKTELIDESYLTNPKNFRKINKLIEKFKETHDVPEVKKGKVDWDDLARRMRESKSRLARSVSRV